jgi:hypothetical protein
MRISQMVVRMQHWIRKVRGMNAMNLYKDCSKISAGVSLPAVVPSHSWLDAEVAAGAQTVIAEEPGEA